MKASHPDARRTPAERRTVPAMAKDEDTLSEQLRDEIVKCWTSTLRERFDWGEQPLASYEFATGFVRGLDPYNLGEVALLCSMVACGRATELAGFKVDRRISERHQATSRCADGAQSWRCTRRSRVNRAFLDYWILSTGGIEFESFWHCRPVTRLLVDEVNRAAT